MWPDLWVVQTPDGPVTLHSFGALTLLAMLAVPAYVLARARLVGVPGAHLFGAWVGGVVGGVVGAAAGAALGLRGLGVVGSAAGVLLHLRLYPVPVRGLPDLVAPGIALSLGLSHAACFFAGCCSGAVAPTPSHPLGLLPASFSGGQVWLSTTFPFLTLEFHHGVGNNGVPLYPTQLWAMCLWFPLAAWLSWRLPRRRFDGEVAAWALVLGSPAWWLTGWLGAAAAEPGPSALVAGAVVALGATLAVLGRRFRPVAPALPPDDVPAL